LFEVPPDVSVQRFFGLDGGHLSYLRFSGIVESNEARSNCFADTYSDSPGCIHRIYPPKESMNLFLENRRLFMSIRVLAHSAIRLAWIVLFRRCTQRWPFQVKPLTFVGWEP
jgi:hypothetical protein